MFSWCWERRAEKKRFKTQEHVKLIVREWSLRRWEKMGFLSSWWNCCRSRKRQMFHFDQKNDDYSDLQVGIWEYLMASSPSWGHQTMAGKAIKEGKRISGKERSTKETEKVTWAQHQREDNLRMHEALGPVNWSLFITEKFWKLIEGGPSTTRITEMSRRVRREGSSYMWLERILKGEGRGGVGAKGHSNLIQEEKRSQIEGKSKVWQRS